MNRLKFLSLIIFLIALNCCTVAHQQNASSDNGVSGQTSGKTAGSEKATTFDQGENVQSKNSNDKVSNNLQDKSVDYEKEFDPQIDAFLQQIYNKPSDNDSFYHYNKIDLNDDNVSDALVYVSGSVCGTGGCNLLILKGNGQSYEELRTYLTRTPVIVPGTKTNGWKDLIISLGGGGIPKGYYVRLASDGTNYPEDAFDLPALKKKETAGVSYLGGIKDFRAGFPLKPNSTNQSTISSLPAAEQESGDQMMRWGKDTNGKTIRVEFSANKSKSWEENHTPVRARFTPKSASYETLWIRGTTDVYLVNAKAGQTMTVKISAKKKKGFPNSERDATFDVFNVRTNQPLPGDGLNWSGKLPEAGDYAISVVGYQGYTDYQLKIEVH